MRKLDTALMGYFGKKYLPFIWLRAYVKRIFENKVETVSPISVPDRKYDDMLRNSFSETIQLLAAKPTLPAYFGGCNYVGGDLEIYDLMLATYKPQTILEIGSGGSTQFAFYKTVDTKITAVDPEPRTVIPCGVQSRVQFIQKICEEVDLAIFDVLEDNDILFIDSSHLKAEAKYHVEKILPRLKPGVIIHHHDIYYPYDINPQWGEQKVVLEHYFQNRDQYEILLPSAYAYYFNNWLFRTRVKLAKQQPANNIPSSFWVKKL